jgi:hypothetical protein
MAGGDGIGAHRGTGRHREVDAWAEELIGSPLDDGPETPSPTAPTPGARTADPAAPGGGGRGGERPDRPPEATDAAASGAAAASSAAPRSRPVREMTLRQEFTVPARFDELRALVERWLASQVMSRTEDIHREQALVAASNLAALYADLGSAFVGARIQLVGRLIPGPGAARYERVEFSSPNAEDIGGGRRGGGGGSGGGGGGGSGGSAGSGAGTATGAREPLVSASLSGEFTIAKHTIIPSRPLGRFILVKVDVQGVVDYELTAPHGPGGVGVGAGLDGGIGEGPAIHAEASGEITSLFSNADLTWSLGAEFSGVTEGSAGFGVSGGTAEFAGSPVVMPLPSAEFILARRTNEGGWEAAVVEFSIPIPVALRFQLTLPSGNHLEITPHVDFVASFTPNWPNVLAELATRGATGAGAGTASAAAAALPAIVGLAGVALTIGCAAAELKRGDDRNATGRAMQQWIVHYCCAYAHVLRGEPPGSGGAAGAGAAAGRDRLAALASSGHTPEQIRAQDFRRLYEEAWQALGSERERWVRWLAEEFDHGSTVYAEGFIGGSRFAESGYTLFAR